MDELMELLTPHLKVDGDEREKVLMSVKDYVSKENEKYTSNLTKNKNEILEEKRQLKASLDDYKDKYAFLDKMDGGFSQEKYYDMESQLESLRASNSQTSDEITKKLNERYEAGKEAAASTYTPQLTAFQVREKQANEERDKYKTHFQQYQIQDRIQKSLSKIGVQADEFWVEGFKASAKPNFDENGLTELSVRHKGNYIPIEDWVNVFPTTDEGKKMIPAAQNTGGGARGSGSGKGGVMTLEEIAQIPDEGARYAAMDKFMASAM